MKFLRFRRRLYCASDGSIVFHCFGIRLLTIYLLLLLSQGHEPHLRHLGEGYRTL